MPPRSRKIDLASLQHLPDWCVIDDAQTAAAIGLSEDTLGRLDERGEGIARTELSDRRHGRTIGNIKAWVARRTATTSDTT
jgi:hypothetical protein